MKKVIICIEDTHEDENAKIISRSVGDFLNSLGAKHSINIEDTPVLDIPRFVQKPCHKRNMEEIYG